MKFFLDTEFIEDGKTIDLLSIGIVCENGEKVYAESAKADLSKVSPWVQENVLPHLRGGGWALGPIMLRQGILDFVTRNTPAGDKPEFWGYYADYDWVALCQLFGTMMDLPKGWPMYCRDIKQLCDDLGNPRLPEQGKGEHHALADAEWNQQAYEFLKAIQERAQDRLSEGSRDE